MIYVAEYKSKHKLSEENYEIWLNTSLEIIQQIFEVEKDNVFLKLRERQKGDQQYTKLNQEKKELIVDETSMQYLYTKTIDTRFEVLSTPIKNNTDIEKNSLSFIVNLSDYLDTGLFLDHRITRQIVKEIAKNKRVLNLFSYTGSFTVYAASGGAKSITTVDLSKTYINWAKRNLTYNKLYDDTKHEFLQTDVLKYLKTVEPNSFDIIILDPPTFSNSKRMDDLLDIQRDHVFIINQCLNALDKNGVLIFSTNYRNFELDTNKLNTKSIKDITKQTTPYDFEGKLMRKCYWIEK
jgi:23S rRNA (cytosine1962-C5)-methyltransferase